MPLVTQQPNALTAHFPLISPPRRHRLLAGIVLSVLAHVALIWLYRPGAPRLHTEPPAAQPITVRIRLPEPALRPAPPPPPAIPSQRAPKPSAAPRAAAPSRPVIAMSPATNEPPQTNTVTPSELTPQQAPPAFDVDKARQQARKLANAPDPGLPDTPLRRLAARTEAERSWQTKAERAFEAARRPQCKDGIPGVFTGVLAPVNLLFDKKDSGCKW